MAEIPTLEEEDAKRPTREREGLVRERTRLVNRIKGALARLGIQGFKPTLRQAPEHRSTLRLPEGAPLPPNTLAELRRDMARLRFVLDQIREIEAARLDQLEQHSEKGTAAQARNQLVDVVQSWAEELFRLRAKPAGPQSEECRLDLGPPFHGRRKLRIWRWLGTLTQRACRLPHRARFPGGSYWRRAGRLICGLRTEILLVRSSGGALTVRRHVRTCADQQRTSRRGSLGAACRLNCCTAARVVRENTTAPAHALVLVA